MSDLLHRLPRTLVAYPGTGMFAQQVARTFEEDGTLAAFATTFAYRPDGALGRVIARLPDDLRRRLEREFTRRVVTEVAPDQLRTMAGLELCRTTLTRMGASAVVVDRVWDAMCHNFDRWVAGQIDRETRAVYAYEYTALATFERARVLGIACLLDLPSLHSRWSEEIGRRELQQFPHLSGGHDSYFARKYPLRQARRDAEVAAADVLIANSRLTMRSHVAHGADASRFVVVPLAMPEPICVDRLSCRATTPPLRVAWAGNFSVRKGAHYFLQAWRALAPAGHAVADVYGSILLPGEAVRGVEAMTFHGALPRSVLLDRLEQADVLVMPSLADGFGLVIGEALSRGVPVIVSDQTGAADIVENGRNGFVIPAADADAIRHALAWCLDARTDLARMRHAALDTARCWQWSDYRRALADALRRAFARRSAA